MSNASPDPGASDRSQHRPVLLREVIQHLDLRSGLIVVDGTVGAAGHSREILKHIGEQGTLIGLDRDPTMLQWAAATLAEANCYLRNVSYIRLSDVLEELEIQYVDRILLDLGLSSDQLDDESRGFSFRSGGPLDLRFNPSEGQPAWELIGRLTETELEAILREYGEERFSKAIARQITSRRTTNPVHTAADLAEAVKNAIPETNQKQMTAHPATRTFQALRIAVNHELEHLQTALSQTLPSALAVGGRAVVVSFHSLEDRLVKAEFRRKERWRNLTPKPVVASAVEKRINPRCRTAKLRAAIKK